MKFENVQVYNFKHAFMGMRNPKNSWHLSDSYFGLTDSQLLYDEIATKWILEEFPGFPIESTLEVDKKYNNRIKWLKTNGVLQTGNGTVKELALIGPKDMRLAQTLIRSGPEHRKFLRQIFVSVDITAPQYWWAEADTYKVATVANSTSKMHKLASTPITLDCFETDDFDPTVEKEWIGMGATEFIIKYCEWLRRKYNETKDKRYWKELIRWLPEGWLQKRTWTCNYETLLSICSKSQRRFHKLTEWSESFINFARSLPYAQDLIFIDELDSIKNK